MKNNNNKNNNFMKLIIILILLSITLYFSFSDLTYKETFNSNYKNLCKNKPTKFYSNIIPIISTDYGDYGEPNSNSNSCEHKCNITDKCNLYIYNGPNDNSCNLYSLTKGNSVYINCDKKEILNEYKGTYLGEGLVKTNYYNNNISDFSYHNFLLDKTLELKSAFDDYKTTSQNLDYKDNTLNVLTKYKQDKIVPIINKVKTHLDLSNNLFTSISDKIPGYSSEKNLNFQGKDISAGILYNKFLNLDKNRNFNEASTINNNLAFSKNSFTYAILSIILIISIILIVLYKLFPNYLNESTLFIYFIFILFIVFFIHILL